MFQSNRGGIAQPQIWITSVSGLPTLVWYKASLVCSYRPRLLKNCLSRLYFSIVLKLFTLGQLSFEKKMKIKSHSLILSFHSGYHFWTEQSWLWSGADICEMSLSEWIRAMSSAYREVMNCRLLHVPAKNYIKRKEGKAATLWYSNPDRSTSSGFLTNSDPERTVRVEYIF